MVDVWYTENDIFGDSVNIASIDEVRDTLDDMVKKGYVAMHIDNEGILRYEFPDLMTGTTQIEDQSQ
jgi:hypothetical protein